MITLKTTAKSFGKSALALCLTAIGGVAVSAGMAGEAQAAAQRIDCPHSRVRGEVVTPMRRGWWSTPQIRSLQDARVASIGGREALLCDYGEAGVIQRYAPRGQDCHSHGSGFFCEASRPVLRSGALAIKQTRTADLDRGTTRRSRGADIWLQAATRHHLYLTPRSGAQISVGGFDARGYDGCKTARYHSGRYSLRDLPVGSHVCVKTSQGRIAEFLVKDVSRGRGPKTLAIDYTTWK